MTLPGWPGGPDDDVLVVVRDPIAARTRGAATAPTGSRRWRLFACPPSGAGPQYFRPMADAVERRGGQLVSVRHPGRESRLGEAPATRLGVLVDEVTPRLAALLADGVPTVLLGHSLGVGVAAHCAARLADAGGPAPVLVVLSAREAPSTPARTRDVRLRRLAHDDEALWEWLRSLGGTPAELLDDPDYRAMLLPILRSDLTASVGDDVLPRPAGGELDLPLLLVCGDADPVVRLDVMADWAALTAGPVSSLEITGGHHALLDDAERVLDAIEARLHSVVDPA